MPDLVSDIFSLQTSIGSPSPSKQGFGTVLLLSSGESFAESLRTYSKVADSNADAELSADAKARLVTAFSQTPKPSSVKVAKRAADVAQVDTVLVVASADGDYTVTLNGTAFTFTASTSTVTNIRDGLVALINLGSIPVTAAPVSTDTLTLTADVAGAGFTTLVSTGLTLTLTTANVGVATHIADLLDEDWFGLVLNTRSDTDILRAATLIEATDRVFVGQSNSSDIKGSGTSDVASEIKTSSFKKSKVFYYSDNAAHADIANLCKLLAVDMDQNTPQDELLTLAGIAVDSGLTSTEVANLRSKNVTYYGTLKGLPSTAVGLSAAGYDFELTITYLWTEARMLENMAALMHRIANSSGRIYYNDQGFAQLAGQAEEVLEKGKRIRHFNFTELAYTKRADVPADDVRDQIFRFEWGAQYSGRVKQVAVQGYISTDFTTLQAA